jgi:hypothetical protein
MSKYMTPVLVLVLAVLAITLAYKGSVVVTGMATNLYNASYREFNVSTGNATPVIYDAAGTSGSIDCYDDTNGDATKVTLNAFSNMTVVCNATVSDDNGCQDFNGSLSGNSLIGEFYDSTQSQPCGSDGSKNCYNNATCAPVGACVGYMNQTVECRYTVFYNANNTTWTGFLNVTDKTGLIDTGTDTITVDNLNSLNVTNSTMNMGTLSPGANTSTHTKGSEIANGGNIKIDLNINGTSVFDCPTNPDIGIGNLTYNYTSAGTWPGTAVTTTATATQFNLDSAADSVGAPTAPTDNMFWGIGIPLGTVGGQTCNATIRVAAIMDQ